MSAKYNNKLFVLIYVILNLNFGLIIILFYKIRAHPKWPYLTLAAFLKDPVYKYSQILRY